MTFRLADTIFWVAVACCAVAQLAIIRSAVVSPARPTNSATPTSAARRAGEIAWAILPGIALVLLFVYTWSAIHPAVVQSIGNPLR